MASDTILSNGDFDYNWTAIDSNSNWALLQQSIFDGIWDKIDLDDDLNNGSFEDNYTRTMVPACSGPSGIGRLCADPCSSGLHDSCLMSHTSLDRRGIELSN